MTEKICAPGLYRAADGDVPALDTLEQLPALCDEALTQRCPIASFVGSANVRRIAPDIWWVGASDKRLALFENAYPLANGVAYNTYLLIDEKVVLIDTIDRAVSGQFLENLEALLGGRAIDYVVVNHMEPDHSASLGQVLARWPQAQVVCTGLAAKFVGQYFDEAARARCLAVAEGDCLITGRHALSFVEAPWVHWPEVMMSYDVATGVLFSADAFGAFGALDGNIFADQMDCVHDKGWLDEARRYYCNIVGKYGPHVQKVLAKAATLDIKTLCPTHGPVWRRDLSWIIDKYSKWAGYEPEDTNVVIFCASVYGGTENAASILAAKLSAAGISGVRVYDVSKTHRSTCLAEAFRCSHLVFASITYNNGIFTSMRDLLADLADHHLVSRHVSFIENGTWHANSGKLMHEMVATMPDMVEVGSTITLKSTVSSEAVERLGALADAIAASLKGDASHDTRLSDPLPMVDTASGASKH